jgi:hypothetical protein
MGGLLPNRLAAEPGFDPVTDAPRMSGYWANVTQATGMPYPARLSRTPVSSEEACLAIKAAERQGREQSDRLLRRLREACFVFSEPADDRARIAAVAAGIPGLDTARLLVDCDAPEVRSAYEADWEETRHPNQYVLDLREDTPGAGNAKQQNGRWRYVFPTLIFRGPAGERTVPGWKPYEAYLQAMETASPGSTTTPQPMPTPSAAEAFGSWPLLTERELQLICGPDSFQELPHGLVEYDWGAGSVWITAEEAATSMAAGQLQA